MELIIQLPFQVVYEPESCELVFHSNQTNSKGLNDQYAFRLFYFKQAFLVLDGL